ncbi:2-oxoisovalerate dehydrogenase E2 component (dihydrolipoyl transacylase) [Paenibacillus sp. 1_12]|uniref:dihydrolipoamide acetyltransferase family protein n=1 Tax=Paenibacillus sp. 1_12 TaxID=1566278 RepID=UPI0008E55B41|nr:dihydrolipoamide acetyltransferase family protein [Paenibacillus sp. 1_12]SFK93276.1 2-oxoisovalerate dehydrogenase E2 component (dihydrolipoyl transacylase) [Paenibacillus sp. 1_12]
MNPNTRGTEVTVPHLAESLVAATIGKWLKQPGDYIEEYDALCELITEKVTTEMPSPIAGRLVQILVGDGETAAVGEAICLIEEPSSLQKEAASTTPEQTRSVASSTTFQAPEGADTSMRGRYSPAVLKLAGDYGVRLENVQGTGLGGRITRKDIEEYASTQKTNTAHTSLPASERSNANGAAAEEADQAKKIRDRVRTTGIHLSENPTLPKVEVEEPSGEPGNEYFIDVTPIRNMIASRTRQSVSEIPHAWTMIEVDVTNLVQLRNKLKDDFRKQEGINLTYLSFLLKAVVSALKDFPIMNSVWAVDKIIVKRDINLTLLVGTEDFVVNPVIKKADQKSIAGLAREIDELSRKARAGKLTLNDMQGGTFTVNNTGAFGSILSYPIINYPQAAIVTFESIVKKPVVIQDMLAVRSMVNLCLSLDHRILDGVICGRFLQRIKENLESYNQETKLY